jgi:hypothetical protein
MLQPVDQPSTESPQRDPTFRVAWGRNAPLTEDEGERFQRGDFWVSVCSEDGDVMESYGTTKAMLVAHHNSSAYLCEGAPLLRDEDLTDDNWEG